jgi:hypothetical protein
MKCPRRNTSQQGGNRLLLRHDVVPVISSETVLIPQCNPQYAAHTTLKRSGTKQLPFEGFHLALLVACAETLQDALQLTVLLAQGCFVVAVDVTKHTVVSLCPDDIEQGASKARMLGASPLKVTYHSRHSAQKGTYAVSQRRLYHTCADSRRR